MRIAMVGPFGFHPNKTMRSRALPLARILASRGYQVQMFMPPWQTPDEGDRRWQEDGVTVRYTPLQSGVPGATVRLINEVRTWSPDVLHCFKPKAYSGFVAWWFWYFQHAARLVTDTDDWEGPGGWNDAAPYSGWQKRLFAWQENWGLTHNKALTVASRTLQDRALAQGVPSGNIYYLPNGPGIGGDAPLAAQKRSALGLEDRPVILLYSRLFEFDTSRLVDILQRVMSAVPDAVALMVGAALYEDDARQLRLALGERDLTNRIINVGWVDEEDLPNVLAAADAGLYLMDDTLLNRAKCPVKLADMLSLGVPLAAEDVGQVSEYVINGKTGRLRPSGDTAGVAADLVELLQDEKLRQHLGAGGRAHIREQFSWPRLADVAEAAYLGS